MTISYSDRLTRFTYENLWKNTFLCKLYIFILVVYKTKIVIMFFSFLYSGSAYPITLWQSLKTHFYVYYVFHFFLIVKNHKKWEYVVDNIIFGTSCPINLSQSLITHFYLKLFILFFLVVNKNKNSYYVFNILIFRISLHYYHMTIFENIFICKLLICCLYSRKQQKRLLECR